MKLGRLHLTGANAWPDHLLACWQVLGFAVATWRLVFGVEIRTLKYGPGIVVTLYLGWWCFEAFLDTAGEWDD